MKQFKQAVLSSCCFWLATLPLSAYAIDLQAVYQLAVQNDASFAASQQAFEATKMNQPLAQAAMKPSVTASAGLDWKYNKFSPDGGVGQGASSNNGQIALNLQQKIYDVRERLNETQANVSIEIARLNLAQQAQALVLNVAQRYFDVLAAQDQKSLAEKEQTAIGRQLDLAQQRLEVGLGTKTDLYDANARFLLAEASLIGADNAIANARQSLEELIGQVLPEQLAVLASPSSVGDGVGATLSVQEWLDRAKQGSIAVLLAKQVYESARLDSDKARKLKNPVVSVSGGIALADAGSTASSPAGENQSWNIGVNVSVPIYQGGAIKAQQIQAEHKRTESELKLLQAEREVETAVLSTYRGVHSSQRQVVALAEAVKASESALEAKEEGFKAGVTTNLDVLDGQRDLFNARSNYLSARYATILAQLRLEQAVGSLDEKVIAETNQRYMQH